MSLFPEELPPLDAHAHLSPDVTAAQVRRLDGAVVFAMTRSLAEAEYVAARRDPSLVWGLGCHPTAYSELASFDISHFERLLESFALVGEVGLDFRGGPRQQEVFGQIMRVASSHPVLVSIHSTGMVKEVLDTLGAAPHGGLILHWFAGGALDIERACDLGCYFSINAAMADAQIEALPRDRVLPETDYPAASSTRAGRPGDVRAIEDRLAKLWLLSTQEVRHRLYSNTRRVALESGAIERMPSDVAGHLLAA